MSVKFNAQQLQSHHEFSTTMITEEGLGRKNEKPSRITWWVMPS